MAATDADADRESTISVQLLTPKAVCLVV